MSAAKSSGLFPMDSLVTSSLRPARLLIASVAGEPWRLQEAAVYEWVVMEGGGEVGICWSGSGVFSPSSSIGSSSLTCHKRGDESCYAVCV